MTLPGPAGEVGDCQPQQMSCCPGQQDSIHFPPFVGMEGVIEKAWPGDHTPQQVTYCLLNSSIFNCILGTVISKYGIIGRIRENRCEAPRHITCHLAGA